MESNYYVVKERFGSGSNLIGLKLNKKRALAHAKKLSHPIFQPYIAGQEISVDAWIDRSNLVKGLVLRKREFIVNGESKVTTTFRNQEFENQFKIFLENFQFYGHVVLQAIINQQGEIQIIECNARFGGASTASITVGLDSLYWSILDSFNEDIKNHPFNRSDIEFTQVRVQQDFNYPVTND